MMKRRNNFIFVVSVIFIIVAVVAGLAATYFQWIMFNEAMNGDFWDWVKYWLIFGN